MRLMAMVLMMLAADVLSAAGHAFVPAQAVYYQYSLTQKVAWQSAGEELAFSTRLQWQFLLLPRRHRDDGMAEVDATVVQVAARHRGPGVDLRVDSNRDLPGNDDPRLGNLLALAGITLQLVVDPTTGRVAGVDGWQAIVERIDQAHPGSHARRAPYHAEAERIFGPERLVRLWSELLKVPAAGEERVPLLEPVDGSAIRTWNGDAYALALAPGETEVALGEDPAPVVLHLRDLEGEGAVSFVDGVLRRSRAAMTFTIDGEALTQGLSQRHSVEWELGMVDLKRGAADAGDDAQADDQTDSPADDATGLDTDQP
jgi:hypothetical protein